MVSEKSLVFSDMGGDMIHEHQFRIKILKNPVIYEKSVVFGAIFTAL